MMALEKQVYSKSLASLFECSSIGNTSISISGLAIDSREVKAGDLFMAYRGTDTNGIKYIDAAIKSGAVAIAVDDQEMIDTVKTSIPIIRVPQLRKQVGLIASRFYDEPSNAMNMVGITGTNGKTTISYLITKALSMCGKHAALIGTLGYGQLKQIKPGHMTTPDPLKLHSLFASWRNEIDYVTMEVSSHALDQGRVAGVIFDIAVFTNLSRDHLDYHHSIEKYSEAKSLLFKLPSLKYAVINADDNYGMKLIKKLPGELDVITYTLDKTRYDLQDTDVVYGKSEQRNALITKLSIDSPWGSAIVNTALLGKFNLENILAAFTVLCLLGIAIGTVAKLISSFNGIPGRMEYFTVIDKPLTIIDYAHTPDALVKVLTVLRTYCKGKLYCVFGCGGDRDEGKRAQMGSIAESFSDEVVLTNDNPRTEAPERIIAQILSGIKDKRRITIKYDRSDAIIDTFFNANKNDIVLIAGKGHETTQQIGKDFFPFSDRQLVKRLVEGEI